MIKKCATMTEARNVAARLRRLFYSDTGLEIYTTHSSVVVENVDYYPQVGIQLKHLMGFQEIAAI
jgi:hypothetical protein